MVDGSSHLADEGHVASDVWRPGDFSCLNEALDHAARGSHGMTFFDGRGEVLRELSYRELRERAVLAARRLIALPGVSRGDRIALIAETRPEFAILFFACEYAGLVPVPMPATVSLGGKDFYLRQLRFLISNSEARAAFATEEFAGFLRDAVGDLPLALVGTLEDLDEIAPAATVPPSPVPDENRLRTVHIRQYARSARRAHHAACGDA
ncbi:MAG: AMP-binding protein [Gammaproteobacteria bacterium]|nr:AMP-binding protein [Gammaproteobacteria bacterium]